MIEERDDQYFEEGHAAFSNDPTSQNPYVGKGDMVAAMGWGLGFYAASEDAAAFRNRSTS